MGKGGRGREREGEREGEREREQERGGESGRERGRERGRDRCRSTLIHIHMGARTRGEGTHEAIIESSGPKALPKFDSVPDPEPLRSISYFSLSSFPQNWPAQ